jgi:hypothetical protein
VSLEYLEHPREKGLYVAYVNDTVCNARYADKRLLSWDGKNWSYPMSAQNYRDTVYGCIGPLPALELTE